jgi:H+/gluconate symporter-like permease
MTVADTIKRWSAMETIVSIVGVVLVLAASAVV